ncbi:4'-phosphopantetheinyl transferase [Granulicella mallensis MP5ACTX8]|uniref:Enterobactin synthase component D n=2 Tax=Granulicella mallensis TaxID=940614 RepID=G8NU20_GRAMM|nr:4'-phosphopantetheinyl transferase [Granulicella mallensis MP5ACTX8]
MTSKISSTLMGTIVPAGIYCSEQVGRLSGSLLPAEEELLGPRTVDKRRIEFAAGRTCARGALRLLGRPSAPLMQGKRHEPLWPEGIVGSITHCKNYCAAAVAGTKAYATIGIDAEPNEPLPAGTLKLIARPRELAWIASRKEQDVCWDRLLFSIKESIYKVWYPLEKCWLEFDQVEIQVHTGTQTFQAIVLRNAPSCPSLLRGAFLNTGSHLLTCVSVRATVCSH